MKTLLALLCIAVAAPAAHRPDTWKPIELGALRATLNKDAKLFEVESGEVTIGLPFLKRMEIAGDTAILTVRSDGGAALAPEIEVVVFNRYGMRLCRSVASFLSDPVPLGGVGAKTVRLATPDIEDVFAVSVIKLPADWKTPRFVTVRQIGEVAVSSAVDPRRPRPRPLITKQQQVRPAILAENKLGTRNIGPTAVDARWSNYGAYLQRMIDTVQIQWERLIIEQRANPVIGSTVSVKFIMDSEGKIARIVNVDSTANEVASRACTSAITNHAPYGPWTDDMRAVLGETQEMTWTFYYQ